MLRISTLNTRIGSKALLPLRTSNTTTTTTTAGLQSWLPSRRLPQQLQSQQQQQSITLTNSFSTSARSFAAIEKKALSKKITLPRDPYLLSEKVVKFAKNGRLDDAITLVMEAPKSRQNEVVWNHLIQESSKLGKINQSWQLLNDMKKRGFEPSDRTFTILLNSLAINASSPNSVSRARALYDQIQQSNDQDLTPTTVHTNALLKVCARQHDYTALQDVYSSMSKHGDNSPDVITYSTLINAYARRGGDEGFESAWKVWEDCLEAKARRAEDVDLDTRIVDGILLACREARSAVFVKRGYKLVESLYGLPASASPFPASSTTTTGTGSSRSGSSSYVSAIERASSPSKHLGLAPAMLRKDSIHPRTVELILSICSKLKDYHRANHYMTLIRTTFPDFKPDPQLLSSLMYLQTANKQHGDAIASWDEISRLDLPHTPATFKQGLDAAFKARNWEKTLEMYTLMQTLITKNKTSNIDNRHQQLINPVVRTQDAWTLVSTLKCAVKTNHLVEGLDILRQSRWTKVVQSSQYPRANVDLANLAVKVYGAMLKSNKEALDGNPTADTTTTSNISGSGDDGATTTGTESTGNDVVTTTTATPRDTDKISREMEKLKRELNDAKAIQTQVTTALADHDAGKAATKEIEDANRLRNRRISQASSSSSSRRSTFEAKGKNEDEMYESDRDSSSRGVGGSGGGWRKVSSEEFTESSNSSRNSSRNSYNYRKDSDNSNNNYNNNGDGDGDRRQKPWTRRYSPSTESATSSSAAATAKPRRYQRDDDDRRSATVDNPFKPTTRFVRTMNE